MVKNFLALCGAMILVAGIAGCASGRPGLNGTASGESGTGVGSKDVAMRGQASHVPDETSHTTNTANSSSKADTSNTAPPTEGSVPDLSNDPTAGSAPATLSGKLVGLDGKKYDLASLKGQVVVIDYWAPWCPPCRAGFPFTQRMSDTFKGKGLVVIAATTDPKYPGAGDSMESIKDFLTKNKYNLPVALDPDAKFAMAQQITGLPTTIFVNKQGKIVAREVGLYPQSESISNLKKAGLDVGNFAPKDDPVTGQ